MEKSFTTGLPKFRILRVLVVVTLISVLISDGIYFVATLIDPALLIKEGYIISTIVPLLIAPSMSFFIVKARYRAEVLMRELAVAKSKAEASARAKDSFLANMSHEMRTPLTHILGFSELLVEGAFGPLTDEQKGCLNDILASSRQLLSIVNDVLDLAKIEAGKIELEMEGIDVKDFLEEILKVFERDARGKGIKVTKSIGDIEGKLVADRKKLERVFYNLLSNSLKFTPPNGRIRINVYSFRNSKGKSRVHFEISDTGIGIASENLVRIFDSFEQVENGRMREYHGTGLGLAISKRLVEQHNGEIWAESPGEGRGSTFHIVLPLRDLSDE